MADVVVTPMQHSGPPRRSRNLEERLMVRFPGVYRALAALNQRRLSPRSRLRRALVRRAVVSGWAAASRRDWELMLVRYGPDVEVEWDRDFEALGLGGTYRGHEEFLGLAGSVVEAWEGWEVTPAAVLDLGDRAVVLGTTLLPGTASGLELESEFAQISTIRDGLVVYDRTFMSWEKGLRAAGLDPEAVALPSRRDVKAATQRP